jgi:hypothetical protein
MVRSAGDFVAGETFDVPLPLHDFVVDPALKPMAKKLPTHTIELTVEPIWCHTLTRPAGLQLFQAQVIPPADPRIDPSARSEGSRFRFNRLRSRSKIVVRILNSRTFNFLR